MCGVIVVIVVEHKRVAHCQRKRYRELMIFTSVCGFWNAAIVNTCQFCERVQHLLQCLHNYFSGEKCQINWLHTIHVFQQAKFRPSNKNDCSQIHSLNAKEKKHEKRPE